MTRIGVHSYGRSMYGGWYANAYVIDENNRWVFDENRGTHTNTLRELKAWAQANNTELKHRLDND